MGCLSELLLLPIEAILELVVEGWLSLMLLIVPDKFVSKGLEIALKIIVTVFFVAVMVVFVLGLLVAIFTKATVFELWKFIFIPLGISIVQIILGVVVRCTVNKK